MQVSVDLQPPFSYSIYYIIGCLLILIIVTIYFIVRKINCNKKNKTLNIIKETKNININEIKLKYLKKLCKIENKIDNNKISIREAYQNISSTIRHFVYEVTNIKVQKYTLSEIKELNMPKLYDLMVEYYEPEFSKNSVGDVKASISKTRKVIEIWN